MPISPTRIASASIADHPNVIVTRSFSKGYSLAGLRLGYLIARPEIVEGLIKVKDSYNCDTLSLAGGVAALEDARISRANRDRILATRAPPDRRRAVARIPSTRRARPTSSGVPAIARPVELYEELKARKILVRLMRYPGIEPGLRITVGHRRGDRFVS